MSKPTSGNSKLSVPELNLLARRLGCFSGRHVLDVSADSAAWVLQTQQRKGTISGIVDVADSTGEGLTCGSPAASISHSAHTVNCVLIRDNSIFAQSSTTVEMTIALANLLSCLKSRGRVVIPVTDLDQARSIWTRRLEGFPGTLRAREIKTGILDYLTLAILFRGIHQIPVLEFTIGRKLLSRLQWHQLAREAVLNRHASSNAAA